METKTRGCTLLTEPSQMVKSTVVLASALPTLGSTRPSCRVLYAKSFLSSDSPLFSITPQFSTNLISCDNTLLLKFCHNPVIAIMSSTNPTHGGSVSDPAQTVAAGKGKGKATDVPQDVSMGEDDSSSDEETGAEDEVCPLPLNGPALSGNIADTLYS